MKKYLLIIIVSLGVGFLLSIFILKKYDGYKGIAIYNEGVMVYFLEYGVYDDYSEMEKNTINLENYIYQVINDKYYVYVGVTKNNEVFDKMSKYYSDLGLNVIKKEFFISNDKFVNIIDNYDNILLLADDNVVIGEVMSQGLMSYEEVVLHGSKN